MAVGVRQLATLDPYQSDGKNCGDDLDNEILSNSLGERLNSSYARKLFCQNLQDRLGRAISIPSKFLLKITLNLGRILVILL